MKTLGFVTLAVLVFAVMVGIRVHQLSAKEVVKEPSTQPSTRPTSVLDFKVKSIDGKDVDLSQYKGKVVMLVNVASKCGNTKQYTALEELYTKYKDQGFVILGFPANDFGGQEPGTNEQIKEFCSTTYKVNFPLMDKISVKGDEASPVYKYLVDGSAGEEFGGKIDWNFAKFLVDRQGNVYARFNAKTKPETPAVVEAIEKGLAAR